MLEFPKINNQLRKIIDNNSISIIKSARDIYQKDKKSIEMDSINIQTTNISRLSNH